MKYEIFMKYLKVEINKLKEENVEGICLIENVVYNAFRLVHDQRDNRELSEETKYIEGVDCIEQVARIAKQQFEYVKNVLIVGREYSKENMNSSCKSIVNQFIQAAEVMTNIFLRDAGLMISGVDRLELWTSLYRTKIEIRSYY